MGSGHSRLPVGALRLLPVPHETENPVALLVPLGRQCHTHRDRQAMAQGAGIHFNTGHLVVGMANEPGAELAVGPKLLLGEEAQIAQNAP
ncbi:hypothetical protein D3C75_670450 [compost metagenome]